jgi:hypothetical protein
MATFEDAVIFVHDVERCLEKLDETAQKLIARIVFQEYTQEETAELLNCRRRTVGRRFPRALDDLSDLFLATGLLKPLAGSEMALRSSCQEAGIQRAAVSCRQDKK